MIWGLYKMLNEKEHKYLSELVVKAKDKCKEQYEIEIKKEIKIDKEKSLQENRALIIQAIKSERDLKLKDKPKIVQKKSVRDSKKELAKKQARELVKKLKEQKEQETQIINKWKEQFNPSMIIKSPAYFEMEKYLEMVCDGFSNFCIIEGSGGLAKTWSSLAILKKKGKASAYLNSFTSPLELYNFLYDNSGYGGVDKPLNPKTILIDDTEGIWDNRAIISILKNATELNGERIISWNSTTAKLDGRAKKCSFHSRIILLTNRLPNPEKNPHIEALLNRAFLCQLKFSYKEKMDIIKEVSKKKYQNITDEKRKEIYDFIKRNTNETTEGLSIRTLIKCYHFYLFDGKMWQDLAMRVLKVDPKREAVFQLINSEKAVDEQIKEYFEITGHSRADYFRIKRELMAKNEGYIKAK